jgi:serine protease Do
MQWDKKLVFVGIVSLFGGVLGSWVYQWAFSGPAPQIINSSDTRSLAELAQFTNYSGQSAGAVANSADFVLASELSSHSVVLIKTLSTQTMTDFWSFWDFYGSQSEVSSAGSGVIFSQDGYIITNNHVIDNATTIEVFLKNKHSYKAKVVGIDPDTDLAVLKIEAKNLKPITVGNSDRVKIGEWVLALGNPLNLTSTVTAGIVSAKGRNINIVKSQFPLESFIQTDAAINPGNSGGALVNLKGELVGINTAIASKTGAYSGYGFAIPVNIVKKVTEDLIQYGEVQTSFLGVEVIDIDDKIKDKIADDDYTGVYVYDVLSDGGGANAGIKIGDIIVKINDEPCNAKSEFMEHMSYYRPGDKIKITLKRGKAVQEVFAKLTNKEGSTGVVVSKTEYSKSLGCKVTPLSKVEKQKMNIENGFRIHDIGNGVIRRMGLPEGFIVMSINRYQPQTVEDLSNLIESARGHIVIEGIGSNGNKGRYSFYMY